VADFVEYEKNHSYQMQEEANMGGWGDGLDYGHSLC